jgi:protein involved in polysaccharide export with SLBB domain
MGSHSRRGGQSRSWWALYALAGCTVVMGACASGVPADSGAPSKTYERQDLESFVEESSEAPAGTGEYVIGVGDVLDVVFVYHHNLNTRGVPVRRDGRISLPYVGDAMAAGLTPMTLDSVLTAQFSEILRDPSLSVIVKEEAERLVYVLGEVEEPGAFPYQEQISLVQAIALARGMKKSAKQAHTVLIRREGLDKIVGIEIDVKAIVNGDAIQNDILLRKYDIVYVPKAAIYSVSDFAREVNTIIGVPMNLVLTGWQIRTLRANYEFFAARGTIE